MEKEEQIWRPISWLAMVEQNNHEMLDDDEGLRRSLLKGIEEPGRLDNELIQRLEDFMQEREFLLKASCRQLEKWQIENTNQELSVRLNAAFRVQRKLELSCSELQTLIEKAKPLSIENLMLKGDAELSLFALLHGV